MLLNNRVTLIVPSTLGDGPAPEDLINREIETTLRAFAGIAGGATAETGQGAWIDSQGKLVRETVCRVYAYCTDAQRPYLIADAERVARDLKRSMRQESVAIVVNDTMRFV